MRPLRDRVSSHFGRKKTPINPRGGVEPAGECLQMSTVPDSVLHVSDDPLHSLPQNERLNSHYKNTSFQQADVTEMEIAQDSYDFIFSNWCAARAQ